MTKDKNKSKTEPGKNKKDPEKKREIEPQNKVEKEKRREIVDRATDSKKPIKGGLG